MEEQDGGFAMLQKVLKQVYMYTENATKESPYSKRSYSPDELLDLSKFQGV